MSGIGFEPPIPERYASVKSLNHHNIITMFRYNEIQECILFMEIVYDSP